MCVLIGLALAAFGPSAWPPPENAELTLEVLSENNLIAGWRIASDGSGEYWEPTVGDPSSIIKRRVEAQKKGYRLVSDLVKPSFLFVENRVKCGAHLPDKPHGTIKWTDTKGHSFVGAFDMGCQLEGSKILIANLSKATQQMRAWSEQGHGAQ